MTTSDRDRLAQLLRARHPCVAIVTADEGAALEEVVAACLEVARPMVSWSVVRGICEGPFAGEQLKRPESATPAHALRQLALDEQSQALVLLDLGPHLDDALTARALRELIERGRATRSTVILIDHDDLLPPAVRRIAVRFEPALPDDARLADAVKDRLRRLKTEEPRIGITLTNPQFADLVRALRGLGRSQAEQVVADVAVAAGGLDARAIPAALAAKHRLLHSSGLLEHVEVPVALDDVAGVDGLKRWLAVRRRIVDGEAGAGIEPPRGVLLLGVPGCGKSMCAKAIATAWQRPLLRLDAGALYDRWVGESESRLRRALAQAEAMAPMVLWVDEIEKAFASAASHSTDGGLSQRMFGTLLTWMQEHTASVFLVATANDIEALPPELLRKGRFDEIFFVDLPDQPARRDILRTHLSRRAMDPAAFDLDLLAARADRFNGAEIEQAIVAAQVEAFADGGATGTERVARALAATVPLAVTMAERVERLRRWARERCVDAAGRR